MTSSAAASASACRRCPSSLLAGMLATVGEEEEEAESALASIERAARAEASAESGEDEPEEVEAAEADEPDAAGDLRANDRADLPGMTADDEDEAEDLVSLSLLPPVNLRAENGNAWWCWVVVWWCAKK